MPIASMRRLAMILVLSAGAVRAEPVELRNGDDLFLSGPSASQTVTAPRDVLIAEATLVLKGSVAQDTHAMGFDVEVEADTTGSVYAAGASVTLRGTIGQDLTASGFSLRTASSAVTAGNARLAGGFVTVEGSVTGALTAAAGEVMLDAPIGGDVVLQAGKISFGPAARIDGTLRYSAPEAMNIPASVIAPERVTFTVLDQSELVRDIGQSMGDHVVPKMPDFGTVLAGFVLTLGFLVAVGAVFLAFLPGPVEWLRQSALAAPGKSLLAGFLGLACLFGLVPVAAITLIGLPLIPFVVLGIVLFWTGGYLLGVYAVTSRVVQSFGGKSDPTTTMRLLALAIGVVAMVVLNFIPFLGWAANVLLMLFGLGALTRVLAMRLGAAPEALSVANTPSPPPAKPE